MLQDDILTVVLKHGPLSTEELRGRVGCELAVLTPELSKLKAKGAITDAKSNSLRRAQRVWKAVLDSNKGKKVPANTVDKGVGTYDGAELKAFEHRRGSMDAYKLPSLASGQLVPPKWLAR